MMNHESRRATNRKGQNGEKQYLFHDLILSGESSAIRAAASRNRTGMMNDESRRATNDRKGQNGHQQELFHDSILLGFIRRRRPSIRKGNS
jgi:hypothetical protein